MDNLSPKDVTVLRDLNMNVLGSLESVGVPASKLMSPPASRKAKTMTSTSQAAGRDTSANGVASATPVTMALSSPRGSSLVDPSPARRDAAAILQNMFSSTSTQGFGSMMSAESSYIQHSTTKYTSTMSRNHGKLTVAASTSTSTSTSAPSTRAGGKRKEKNAVKKIASRNASKKQNNSRQGPGGEVYSRKSKSLGLLCTLFIEFYSQRNAPAISIDYSATLLGVERRRIYDIINILESVSVVKRRCKNTYDWCGVGGLGEVFLKLMWEGIIEGVEGKDGKWMNQRGYRSIISIIEEGYILRGQYDINVPFRFQRGSAKKDVDKDKSLARLSQKFIQMFLTCYNGQGQGVSLADASVWILGEGGEANPRGSDKGTINQEVKGIKTKVRRLYDIANVMVAIGVIEKVGDVKGEKKPVFGWRWGDGNVGNLRGGR